MRKFILPVMTIVLGLASCDMLDRNPKDKLVPETFFRNENDLKLFSNSFYDNLFEKEPFDRQSDIFFEKGTLSDELYAGTNRVPATNTGAGGWSWSQLRKINTMLGNIDKCQDDAVREQYTALARFFRARFYFEKVKRFGDVPWYDKELESTDHDELYKPRDSRELVMQNMIADIDAAIAGLPAGVSTYRVNKWAALMLKAQFCLYEGTFRKYHKVQINAAEAGVETVNTPEDYLELAAEAAYKLLTESPYSLASDYHELFRQVDADQNEYILAIKSDPANNITHSGSSYCIMATGGNPGFSKKFVDSFLMKNGSRFTDKEGWKTMQFVEQCKDRDPRLGMIMRLPGHVRVTDKYAQFGPDINNTSSGYQYEKFVMAPEFATIADRAGMAWNDIPVYRFAEAHLIYAEAKAELGNIGQEDLDISINKLRKRAGMPDLKADVTADPYLMSEKYGYPYVASLNPDKLALILEIRRERTIELVLEDSGRWHDIVRWKEGKCYDQDLHGMYFPGPGVYDTTGDGKPDYCLYDTKDAPESGKGLICIQIQDIEIDGKFVPYVDGIILSEGNKGFSDKHKGKREKFNEQRDYLYPLPIGELVLNENLTQNPGWPTGTSAE